jgi:hypothetical protein
MTRLREEVGTDGEDPGAMAPRRGAWIRRSARSTLLWAVVFLAALWALLLFL